MDKALIARAQEIAENSPEPTSIEDAIAAALRERFDDDPKLIAAFAAHALKGWAKELRTRTYVLPDQPSLFAIPATIAIRTPLGDLLINSDDATAGQVDQWSMEAERFHSGQKRKFKAFRREFKKQSLEDDRNYKEQLRALADETDSR